jgi:hypothetical protein
MPQTNPFLALLGTLEPAELGPGPRTGVQAEPELNAALHKLLKPAGLSGSESDLIRALVLLWHDHLDPAHSLAQSIDNPDGAFVHGIMHRREPDYGNAAYWFRRVGRHEALPQLAEKAATLLKSEPGSAFGERLVQNGNWDPFGFIDACEQAASGEVDSAQVEILKQIQRLETEVLLDVFWGRR